MEINQKFLKLEVLLKINEYNILNDYGKIKIEIAYKLALDDIKSIELYNIKIIFQTLMS